MFEFASHVVRVLTNEVASRGVKPGTLEFLREQQKALLAYRFPAWVVEDEAFEVSTMRDGTPVIREKASGVKYKDPAELHRIASIRFPDERSARICATAAAAWAAEYPTMKSARDLRRVAGRALEALGRGLDAAMPELARLPDLVAVLSADSRAKDDGEAGARTRWAAEGKGRDYWPDYQESGRQARKREPGATKEDIAYELAAKHNIDPSTALRRAKIPPKRKH